MNQKIRIGGGLMTLGAFGFLVYIVLFSIKFFSVTGLLFFAFLAYVPIVSMVFGLTILLLSLLGVLLYGRRWAWLAAVILAFSLPIFLILTDQIDRNDFFTPLLILDPTYTSSLIYLPMLIFLGGVVVAFLGLRQKRIANSTRPNLS